MNLTIKQSTTLTENSSSPNVVETLYQLTKPDPMTGLPSADAVLVGRIQVPSAYEDAVNFLNTQFSADNSDNGSDFQVSVLNNNYYIRFVDPEVVRVLTAKGVIQEDEGLTIAQASELPGGVGGAYDWWFVGNTTIKEFDEIKYFGRLKNGAHQMGQWFTNATNLESVDLTGFTRLHGYMLFQGCKNLEYFHGRNNTPNTLNLEDLTSLSASFNGCLKLYHIASLGAITDLWEAFVNCSNLQDVNLPITCISLNQACFQNCSSLTTINIVHTSKIGPAVFQDCSSLEYCGGGDSPQGELNLPNLTGTLGNNAFKGCSKLTTIASLGSITSIGNSAFENCANLATINFPSTVTSVGNNAFNNTAWYNSQPNGPIYIGNVLYKCKNISGSLVISNNIVSIVEGAFYNCSSLTSVTIGSDVTVIGIGESVFKGCTALSTVVVDSNNAKYDSRDNCNAIIETATNTLFTACKNTVIPNTVTKIADRAFGNIANLTSIVIPNSVTSIGKYCFAGCKNMTTVTISDSVLTSIEEGAFNGCTGLTSIDIPNSVTSIGEGAFNGCSGLTSVAIGNSVTSIGDRAFYCISKINITDLGVFCSIDADNSNSAVPISNLWDNRDGAYADIYLNGTKLIDITVPNSVTQILGIFVGTKIESITIPDSVTLIGSRSFKDCRNLTTIDIGTGLMDIGAYAFERCTNLTSFTIRATIPPTKHNTAFNNLNSNCIFYVPAGSVSAYQSASGWSEYASRIQAIPTT